MRTRSFALAAALVTACGGATTSSSNNSSEAAGIAEAGQGKEGGNQAQPMDNSLKSFADLQGAVDSGGIPGCFDPALSGRERAVAERLGGIPCDRSGDAAGAASGDDWAGRYDGRFDGGGGEATITRTGGNRYAVSMDVAGERGCAGSVQGQAAVQGGRLVVNVPVPDQGGQCRITFTRRGAGLAVEEDNCMYFHGMSCGFSGSVTRRGQSAAAAPRQSAPVSQASWIVGAWTVRGEPCGGHGITFNADGTYGTAEDTGTWTLAGNTLTSVSRATFEMGDMESERAVANPRPVRATVVSRTANSFVQRYSDGSVSTLIRCR